MEVLTGLFAGQQISLTDFWHFLVWTTLVNAIGGVLLVSILKFSHSVSPGKETQEDDVSASIGGRALKAKGMAKHKQSL